MEQTVYHIPALLDESIQGLAIKPEGIYVDVTFGGGGHSRAIMEHLGPKGRLVGMDQDMDACANRLDDDRFTFAHGNFAYLKNFMRTGNVEGRQEKDFYGRVNTPWRVVNTKVIVPDDEEVARNPRSRSAKLRVAELISNNKQ